VPLPAYTRLHREAVLTPSQLDLLKNYLDPAAVASAAPASDLTEDDAQYKQWIEGTHTTPVAARAPNRIEFLPDYKNWKAISFTDRLDNQTMRVILGNDTAIRAIAENHTNPWPNGASFAKAAWSQRGAGLTPYCKDAMFTEECIGCHTHVRNSDRLYDPSVEKIQCE